MADGSLDTYENDAPADGADIVDPSQVVIGEELEQSHGRYRNEPESDTSATQNDDDSE